MTDPEQLRAHLLRLVLRVTAVLGGLVYGPSVYEASKQHLVGLVITDTVALATVCGLAVFERLPYRLRASAICFIFYAIGVSLLFSVGSISQTYLAAFSVVTVLLLGVRAGLGAAFLSSASLLLGGAFGHAPAQVIARASPRADLFAWTVITMNFALVTTLLTLAVGKLLAAVNNALEREIVNRVSLDRERTLLRTLIDSLPDVVFTKDTQGRFVNANLATLAGLGMKREDELVGKTVFDVFTPELAAAFHQEDLGVMAARKLTSREEKSLDPSGGTQWHLTIKAPLRDATGNAVGLLGIRRDITDRKRAEAERDRSLAQLQLQIERLPLACMLTDGNFRFKRWNSSAERIFGFTEAEVLGRHPFEVIIPVAAHPFAESTFASIKAGSMDSHGEVENLTKDGGLITCEWHNTPLFDDAGAFSGLLSVAQDVTGRKKLEEQLRQSQKMEAVGQLAGGVAHDFNNLLSVILSFSEMAIADLREDDPMRRDLQEISRAGSRASDLTRQLLMFSRQQVVEPTVLDLNELLSGIDRMIRRLVGEDIELASVPGASLGRVRADPGSIEQIIVNLIVNARDAMPTGGKLTVETANVDLDETYARAHVDAAPGAYVMLSVSDTGCGMDKPTLARIFEPFFTTKEKGRGTGLGLSTVFGIVQQSGGTVWVYSEVGIGTTFKVYLPRIDGETAAQRQSKAPATLRGSETILLVEDEDQVRDVTRGILLRHGYTVLDARNAGEAFLLCEQHPGRIHLLLSDVVMPKMSGPALAKRLVQTRPDMKVLCMSGYTDDAAVRHGVINAEVAYLQKPITVDGLTTKVRSVLDSDPVRVAT